MESINQKERMKMIPVFFTIDNSYAPFLAVALHSAIRNASPHRQYKAFVLYQDVSEENRRRISALAKPNFEIEFIPMQSGMESITDRMSNRLRCDYFTLTIYFRLFIPTMFPELDKAIYIDSDVVIPGDLAELYDLDLGENYIAACPDHSIEDVEPLVRYTMEAVGMEKGDYINSGVLLMNLKALREKEFDKHFLKLLNTYHLDCIAPDQDYLNALCRGRILYLPACWDAMPNDHKPPLANAKIIHYNLFSKPWCYDGIQYGEEFWHYAEESGYLAEAKAYKAAYTQEQKESDAKCMELLVQRGAEIADSDITFRKLQENGVKVTL